jgi:hypothetical protein
MNLHMYWKRSRLSQAEALVRKTRRRRFGRGRRKLDAILARAARCSLAGHLVTTNSGTTHILNSSLSLLYMVYLTSLSEAQIIQRIIRDREGSSRDLIWVSIPEFVRRNWRNSLKPHSVYLVSRQRFEPNCFRVQDMPIQESITIIIVIVIVIVIIGRNPFLNQSLLQKILPGLSIELDHPVFTYLNFGTTNFYRARSSALRPIPKLNDQVSVFISPLTWWPSFTPRHRVPFRRLLGLAELRWRNSILRSHGIDTTFTFQNWASIIN